MNNDLISREALKKAIRRKMKMKMSTEEVIQTLQAVNGILAMLAMTKEAPDAIKELCKQYAIASDIAIDSVKIVDMIGSEEE